MYSTPSVYPTPTVIDNCIKATYTECLVPSVTLGKFCTECFFALGLLTLLQKRFIVLAVKSFFVSVSPADTILRIQKIDYFSYRLFPADTQNRFSKIKKIGAQIWARWPQIGPCSPTPVEVDDIAGSPQASVEQWESLDRRTVGAVGPPRRREQWERLDCLKQWGLIASTAAYSLPPPSTTSVSL
jgi:hypothetical protein